MNKIIGKGIAIVRGRRTALSGCDHDNCHRTDCIRTDYRLVCREDYTSKIDNPDQQGCPLYIPKKENPND